MIILEYTKKFHTQIIHAAALALEHGKVVAFPTDTSYGLAVDAHNVTAVKKLYKVKGRDFKKPVHIIPATVAEVNKWAKLNTASRKAIKHFWPGAFTIVQPAASKKEVIRLLSAKTFYMGIRIPKHEIATGLAKKLGRAITATSANVSGQPDCYSGDAVIHQFKNRKIKPDILIYVKSLPKRKPSTVVEFHDDGSFEIFRSGPVTKKQIEKVLQK